MSKIKKIILLVIFLLFLSLISYFLFNSFFGRQRGNVTSVKLSVKTFDLPKLDFRLSTDFLAKSPYIDLHLAGPASISVSQLGRRNPFLPIPFVLLESE